MFKTIVTRKTSYRKQWNEAPNKVEGHSISPLNFHLPNYNFLNVINYLQLGYPYGLVTLSETPG